MPITELHKTPQSYASCGQLLFMKGAILRLFIFKYLIPNCHIERSDSAVEISVWGKLKVVAK
jgi:hypothetical protein